VKVLATAACLRARHRLPAAVAQSAGYVALEPAGEQAGSLVALARSGADGSAAVAVVTRLASRLEVTGDDLPHGPSYGETVLDLPGGAPGRWRDVLTGRELEADAGRLSVGEVLAELPVALLLAE